MIKHMLPLFLLLFFGSYMPAEPTTDQSATDPTLVDPPALTAHCGENSTLLSTQLSSEWNYYEGDQLACRIACGFGPLQDGLNPPTLSRQGAQYLTVSSLTPPDQVTAIVWPASVLTLPEEERLMDSGLPLSLHEDGLLLPEDNSSYYILLTAVWDQDGENSFGSAEYVLIIN